MLRALLAAAKKDFLRRLRDPLALLLWMAIPLVTGGMMTALFGDSGAVQPKGIVYVIDQDESLLSGMVARTFDAGPLGEMLQIEQRPLEEARALLARGKGSALVRIPAGFGKAVLEDTPTTIELRTNPSQRIVPKVVQQTLVLLADGVHYIQRIFGEELRTWIARHGTENAARLRAAIGLRIGSSMDKLGDYLFPPLFELEIEEKRMEKGPAFGLLLLPGLLVFALLFLAQGLSEDLWKEREACTLQRAATTPQGFGAIVSGKLLGFGAVLLLVMALLVAIAIGWQEIPWSRYLPILIFTWASGMGLLAMMFLIQTLASSRRGAAIFTSVLVFPLAMLGGSIFPLAVLPDFLATFGRLTPNGWATTELTRMFVSGVDPLRWIFSVLVMLLWVAGFAWAVQWRVRRSWLSGS